MPTLRVKITDVSCDRLIRTAQQCGFVVEDGKKHVKVNTVTGQRITHIPRHARIKRETAQSIVEDLRRFGADVESA